jgi:hypothetical protein
VRKMTRSRYSGRGALVRLLHITSLLLLARGFAFNTSYAGERLGLEVREVAGLARGGYPVHGLVKLPRAVPTTTEFRLLRDGKPVVAQFRPDGEGATAQWWLDFQTEMAPSETRSYTVEFGNDIPAGPERKNGHKLTNSGEMLVIANEPYITWTVPRNLKGFLRSVHFPPAEFLRPDSPGLLIRDRQNRQHTFSGTARVVRQGSMAVALRFENTESEAGLRNVRSAADLTFPAPVSWVEVDWSIDDPLDNVAAVGLGLHAQLDQAGPAIVDFGATSTVYASLRQGQEAELSAGPLTRDAKPGDSHPWEILRGDRGRLTPLALGAKQSVAPRVEGWAHLMDRKNCLALAIDGFGRDNRDTINAAADGKLTLWRDFSPGKSKAPKRLHFWLHFVFSPPQLSAGASPQQMQTPLEVRMTGR